MENNKINKSAEIYFEEGGECYYFKANYGIHQHDNQAPYFSITSELYEKHRFTPVKHLVSCGCQHHLVEKHLPHLKELIKWHLVSVHTGPMHYLANAMFWWERSKIEEKDFVPLYKGDTCAIGAKALEYFKTTIVYGCRKADYDFNIETALREEVDVWLLKRLPSVMTRFRLAMKKFGIVVKKSNLEKGIVNYA
jgi:hypothetical protein